MYSIKRTQKKKVQNCLEVLWLVAGGSRFFTTLAAVGSPRETPNSLQHLSILREESWKTRFYFQQILHECFDTHQESPIDDNPFLLRSPDVSSTSGPKRFVSSVSENSPRAFFHDQLLGAARLALVGGLVTKTHLTSQEGPLDCSQWSMATFSLQYLQAVPRNAGATGQTCPVSSNSWWLTSVKSHKTMSAFCRMQTRRRTRRLSSSTSSPARVLLVD